MNELETIIAGGTGLVLLMLAYHFMWCGALLTVYRQDLFFIRDKMFVDAAKGRIDFHDPGYGMLRLLIQRTLRSSGRTGLIHMLFYWAFLGDVSKTGSLEDNFNQYLATMQNREQADLLRLYQAEITKVTALHFIRFYWPFIGVVLIWVFVRMHAKFAKRMFDSALQSRTPSAQRYLNMIGSDMPAEVHRAANGACPA